MYCDDDNVSDINGTLLRGNQFRRAGIGNGGPSCWIITGRGEDGSPGCILRAVMGKPNFGIRSSPPLCFGEINRTTSNVSSPRDYGIVESMGL